MASLVVVGKIIFGIPAQKIPAQISPAQKKSCSERSILKYREIRTVKKCHSQVANGSKYPFEKNNDSTSLCDKTTFG